MTIRAGIHHHTRYRYSKPVQLSPHVFRLRPAAHGRTPIESYALKIGPEPHFINWQQDPFGNFLARVVFPGKVTELSIDVDIVADMTVFNPFDFFIEESAEKIPFAYDRLLSEELAPYLAIREDGARLKDWLKTVPGDGINTIDFLVALNQRLARDIAYTIRMEPGIQTCEETLEKALGSCRDSAWLLVQIMRHLGLAARFVSGYLVQLTPDVKSLDGPSGTDHDFTDLHAWAEVYIPGAGWIGLDATSGLFAGEGHIPLACTPDPASAAPVTGGFTGDANTEFEFDNRVTRIHEDPRVTKPYSDEQWAAIDALGRQVDDDLQSQDVRLTMGGEPTFVSIDDMDAAEWNTTADGEHKRKLAQDLLRRLHSHFAPGGLLHYGQGKWYPGEPLPRWALGCFWRVDGNPVWRDPDRFADVTADLKADSVAARGFVDRLAMTLGVNREHVLPAYEDPLHYVATEDRLPVNVDPLDCNLDDTSERRRLARLLQHGLDAVTGYVLPLSRSDDDDEWHNSKWEFRRGHLFLVPGDSPMGLRLPLDELPWVEPKQRKMQHPRDLFGPLPPIGDVHGEVAKRFSSMQPEINLHPEIHEQPVGSADDETIAHTALCVEPRDGRLHIFLPPLTHLEHWLDLVASIEATAEALKIAVVMEGYEPPRDPRLNRLMVTPDPGVIEVNIHPAKSWEEVVHNTTLLYEQARLSRLGTEKFMLDGRHTGTGGGNHVTLGAANPDDSPMLRRPDLLRSLVSYWQHHPSLSYLFSGMFIGPTSQAPRVDEGRDDRLYELEIAFQQMPEGDVPAPWLVDRLLRNLLIDITGNTHRAEFCIDKLYSPDSATGRLGLLELRAFEMPPHARMSLVQMLLVRALTAWFWREPYRHPLVRWGTALHDRFLLPHYVREDMRHVVDDLQRAGYPFALDWLEPYMEFRFPRYGTVQIRDMALELRFAIEPWHVLGEEVTGQGTARFVDSSVERMQVSLTGLTGSRYVLACNGRRVPLHNTGTQGEYTGGVRYRAWQPPSALHPTIGVHAPLIFDLIDTWNGRSIGGCTYHVTHPGGRNYETFPVNANEAEARRVARFWSHGHTPGKMAIPPVEDNADFPHLLDLRRLPQIT